MNGFRILLAMLIASGEMSNEEADSVYANLQHTPLPEYPSEVLPMVRAELEKIRGERARWE